MRRGLVRGLKDGIGDRTAFLLLGAAASVVAWGVALCHEKGIRPFAGGVRFVRELPWGELAHHLIMPHSCTAIKNKLFLPVVIVVSKQTWVKISDAP